MRFEEVSLGPNLVTNGDFRDSLEHWEGTGLELGTIDERRGLRGNPDRLTYASQQTGEVVTAGTSYRMQFMTVSENIVPNRMVTIQLAATVAGSDRYAGLFTNRYDNAEWTEFAGTFVPQTSGTLQVRIYLINQSPDVRVYMTCVLVAEVLSPLRRIPRCLAWRARSLTGRPSRK